MFYNPTIFQMGAKSTKIRKCYYKIVQRQGYRGTRIDVEDDKCWLLNHANNGSSSVLDPTSAINLELISLNETDELNQHQRELTSMKNHITSMVEKLNQNIAKIESEHMVNIFKLYLGCFQFVYKLFLILILERNSSMH